MAATLEQLFRMYAQHIKNLDNPDELSSDVLMVLVTRNGFERFVLSQNEQLRLNRLDDELANRWEILAEELPNPNLSIDRRRWWWFLHEGPQVREEAKVLAR
jgi:hypothetical protein